MRRPVRTRVGTSRPGCIDLAFSQFSVCFPFRFTIRQVESNDIGLMAIVAKSSGAGLTAVAVKL
jgi:hypothetical protein